MGKCQISNSRGLSFLRPFLRPCTKRAQNIQTNQFC